MKRGMAEVGGGSPGGGSGHPAGGIVSEDWSVMSKVAVAAITSQGKKLHATID